jgi:DNA-binding transcriptional LysR family regulator
MSHPDLNLLITLDVLLAEGSVARAAERLHLSPSAMSRALSRLREVTGDPLLVRAGRGLVATPRAIELRERVGHLVQDAEEMLRPLASPNLREIERLFTLRTSDGFVESFGPGLVSRVAAEAPGIRLNFVQKLNKDSTPLRTGLVDLETGIVDENASPEVMTQALFQDHYVGVVRMDHPLHGSKITLRRYLGARHISVSRRGSEKGPVDEALAAVDAVRSAVVIVSGFSMALGLARTTDLVASVPGRHTENLRAGMHTFALPFPVPTFTVSMMWHPRLGADPVHRWLRNCLREVCAGR